MGTTAIAVGTMKAAQVPRPGAAFEVVEREIPSPASGEVRIKVQACGVCHSDVFTKEGAWPGIQYPRIPGHEVAGIVDEVGDGVSEWKKGQRVGVGWHGGHDGTCRECRRGDFRNCRNLQVTGISYDGGYQEYMVAPTSALVPIPDALSDVDAAPLLCAGITTYNALRHSGALPGDLVAVLGIGGLGHLGIQFANKFGYRVAGNWTRGRERGPGKETRRQRVHRQPGDESSRGSAKTGRRKGNSGDRSQLKSDVCSDRRACAQRQAPGDRRGIRADRGDAGTAHQWKPVDSGLVLRDAGRFGGHPALRRAERRACPDRDISAGEGRGGVRPHDERQGAVSRRADDVRSAGDS